jgi:hypothetical protein
MECSKNSKSTDDVDEYVKHDPRIISLKLTLISRDESKVRPCMRFHVMMGLQGVGLWVMENGVLGGTCVAHFHQLVSAASARTAQTKKSAQVKQYMICLCTRFSGLLGTHRLRDCALCMESLLERDARDGVLLRCVDV